MSSRQISLTSLINSPLAQLLKILQFVILRVRTINKTFRCSKSNQKSSRESLVPKNYYRTKKFPTLKAKNFRATTTHNDSLRPFHNSAVLFSKVFKLRASLGEVCFNLLAGNQKFFKMLYSINLLSIKDGKFGVLWLLGSTSSTKKPVKRKLVDKVGIRQM